MEYTYVIYLIGVITIIYASLSTLRTIDVKELIAYSSVSHAAVYLLAVFSNNIQGIEGGISLGLSHGIVPRYNKASSAWSLSCCLLYGTRGRRSHDLGKAHSRRCS